MVEFCLVEPSSYGSIPANKRMLVRGVRKWKFAASTRVRVISQMAPFFSLLLFFRDDLHLPLSIMAQNWQRLASTRTYVHTCTRVLLFPPPPHSCIFPRGKIRWVLFATAWVSKLPTCHIFFFLPRMTGIVGISRIFPLLRPIYVSMYLRKYWSLKAEIFFGKLQLQCNVEKYFVAVVNRFFLDEKLK